MDVPHVETEHVGPLGRLRARRALVDAEDRVALADEQLEEARLVATSAARMQRTEVIERGERVVQAELPRLIAQLRGTQQAMLAFAERMAELDRPLEGGRCFQEAPWVSLLPQQGLGLLGRVGHRHVQAAAGMTRGPGILAAEQDWPLMGRGRFLDQALGRWNRLWYR